jgi:four helix bundle protein
MKEDNVIKIKSYAFAVRIVKLYQHLCKEKKEFVMSKQILRSGTSIGSNIEEAVGGQSKRDFIAKLSISYKEARETHFWIRLLYDAELISLDEKISLLNDCEELIRIMTSILNTSKANS